MSEKTKGICRVCGGEFTLTANGRIRSHGPVDDRCGGGSDLPREDAPEQPHGNPNPHRAPLPTGQPGPDGHPRPQPSWAGMPFPSHDPEADTWGTEAATGTTQEESDAGLIGEEGDDYFAGPDAPEASGGPGPWFPARFDGDCDACMAHFEAGEDIRADGEGGWQGQECCGWESDPAEEDEEPAPAPAPKSRPVVLRPKVPVENGRYVMPHPRSPGKPWRGSRMTTFVKLASDHYSLKLWELRTALVGATLDADIREAVQGFIDFGASKGYTPSDVVKVYRDDLNALAEKAKSAAGASARAAKGTALHKWGEEVDAGRKTLEEVPAGHRDDIRAYRTRMDAAGITVLPHLIERTTGLLEQGVMGTFDRVFRMDDGKYRVGDKKSGDLKYGQDEIAAQMAGYAHGCNTVGIAEWSGEGNHRDWHTWRWVPLTDEDGSPITVETDWGVVMHLPQGTGTCELYQVDLDTGWRGVQLCNEVRDWHRVKSTMTPLAVPDPETPLPSALEPGEEAGTELVARVSGYTAPVPETRESVALVETVAAARKPSELTWEAEFSAVTDREQANALYQRAVRVGIDPNGERMRELLRLGALALERTARPPERDWEAEFAAVADRDAANVLWRAAQAEPVDPDRLEVLVVIGGAVLSGDRPTARNMYEQLAAYVREERLSREVLDRVTLVMKQRVPA